VTAMVPLPSLGRYIVDLHFGKRPATMLDCELITICIAMECSAP